MYCKSSRFNVALVLGVLVLVMVLLGSCVVAAPTTSDPCGGKYEIGELLHPEGMELEIALTYVQEHYPEQLVPITWQLKKGKLPGPREYEATGGWILTDVSPTVTITNAATGFRWEGAARIERVAGKRRCWLEEVLIIREISVAIPSPAIIHVPTQSLAPTRSP